MTKLWKPTYFSVQNPTLEDFKRQLWYALMLDMNSYMLASCIFDAEPTLKHVAAAPTKTKSICGDAKPCQNREAECRAPRTGVSKVAQHWWLSIWQEMPDQENHQIKNRLCLGDKTHQKQDIDVFWISVQSHLIGSVVFGCVWYGLVSTSKKKKKHLTSLDRHRWKLPRAGHGETSMQSVSKQAQNKFHQMTVAKISTRQWKWQAPTQLMRQLERQHLEIPCVSWCLITPFNIGLWNNVPTTRDLPSVSSVKGSLISRQNWAWKKFGLIETKM